MFGKILLWVAAYVAVFSGCSSDKLDIRAICLRDNIGNYVIKWETVPAIEGILKIAISDTPEHFDDQSPAIYANIHDGVATYITNDNISRKYFQLTFNGKYNCVIGARSIVMDHVQNLRDVGGYPATGGKQVRWDRVFRSGQLGKVDEWDSLRLANLGIRTVIDLRMPEEVAQAPTEHLGDMRVVHAPIAIGKIHDAPKRVIEGRMRKGDALVYMQDEYLQFVTDNSRSLAQALRPFLEERNYPILISCSYGKDRTGFLVAMLLTALGVSYDSVVEDYLMSNRYIDISRLENEVSHLSSDAQESITVFLTANEELLDLAFHKIRKEYGSVERYLEKELELTDKKREKLKELLLY